MAKINVGQSRPKGKTTNYEGGEAFDLKPETKLLHLTATCFFNEPKFYGELGETEQKIFDTCDKVAETNPKFILQLASYLRNEQNLRTVSNVLLVKSANLAQTKGTNFVTSYAPNIIQRADELTEVMAIQLEYFKKPIPNSLKKAIAKCFPKFNEYQFSKYDRDAKVKFKDVIMLTHPKEPSEIIKKILDDELEVPYTWETELSKGKDKKRTWERLINSDKLGIFALVRNLRNILEADVSQKHIAKVIQTLTDEKIIKNSKLFPFRFYQAYKEIQETSNPWTSNVLDALETAMDIAFSNIQKMDGATFIACDTSGSMDNRLSDKSKMSLKEIGVLLGISAHKFTDQSLFGCFGNSFGIYNTTKKSGTISTVENVLSWSNRLGCSTNGFLAIKYLNDKNIKVDRILIFTDCQLYDSTEFPWLCFGISSLTGRHDDGTENTIRKEFNKYRSTVNPDCKLYLFDLSEYGTVNFPESDRSVVNVSGWSEKIFDFIQLYETDPEIQLNYIKTKY